MDWRHILLWVVIFFAGYWVHSKWPGLLSKGSMGVVSA